MFPHDQPEQLSATALETFNNEKEESKDPTEQEILFTAPDKGAWERGSENDLPSPSELITDPGSASSQLRDILASFRNYKRRYVINYSFT
jgi:hypothetical protein